MPDEKRMQIYFFLAVFLAVLALNITVFLPYLGSIIVALTLGSIFKPVHKSFAGVLGGRHAWAAFFVVVLVLLIIVAPIAFFGTLVFREASSLYLSFTQGGQRDFIDNVNLFVNKGLSDFTPNISFGFDATVYFERLLAFFVQNLGKIFSGVANIVFALFLALLTLYYLLKDSAKFKKTIMALSPLADSYDEAVFSKLRATANSVVKGSLLIALIQGALTGLGFFLFGVPSPALWGAVAAITSLIPVVGTAVVIIPGVIYLFSLGAGAAAIGLAVWGAVIVGTSDNLLRPKLMERGINIHPFFILISVLGGLEVFGPVGFLLGPLLLSLMFALVDIYREEFKKHFEKKP